MPTPAGPPKQRTVAIVQARLGSTRLPGKVLKPLGGQRVIDHVMARCRAIPSVDEVVIATTVLPEDDAVVAAAAAAGIGVFRGDSSDVLQRYAGAARMSSAEVVLRVTSDCPLIDPAICERVIRLRADAGADYAANNMPRLFPHGLDCEVFTRAALEAADRTAQDPYDREHVTPWMRRTAGLSRTSLIGPGWPAMQHRWTLDFPEDYDFFSALFPLLPPDEIPSSNAVLAILADRPDIAGINALRRIGGPGSKPKTAPTAVFRFEADPQTGLGHAMRCNALATQMDNNGWRCYWAVSPGTAAFLGQLAPAQACIVLAADTPAIQRAEILAAAGGCQLLIVDRYGENAGLETEMRNASALIVALDDLADRDLDADIVVNPAPAVAASSYHGRIRPESRLLRGPDFAILRRQFLARRRHSLARRADRDRPDQVLVAFGGTDPANGTGLALDALRTLPIQRIDVVLGAHAPHLDAVRSSVAGFGGRARLLVDVAEMADIMAECDFAIGAPGTGTWERACLSLPSLLVGIAENQRANARTVEQSGAGLLSGFTTSDSREAISAHLRRDILRLLAEPQLFRAMQIAAAALCDGRGTMRLATAFVRPSSLADGTPVTLRLAEVADAEILYAWQQAPETRRHAVSQTPFTFDQHRKWLDNKLASDRDWLLLGEARGAACGFLRLDWFGEDRGLPQYLVSIAAAPGWYRRGVGRALLENARRLMPDAHFYARVLAENTASHGLFNACGYRPGDDGYYHAMPHHLEQEAR